MGEPLTACGGGDAPLLLTVHRNGKPKTLREKSPFALTHTLTPRRFYTSGVIKLMLEHGRPFTAVEVDAERDFHVLGTPSQVR